MKTPKWIQGLINIPGKPTKQFEKLEALVRTAFNQKDATIIKAGFTHWGVGNSEVFATPKIQLRNYFGPEDTIQSALNFVFIKGPLPEDEELHYHSSHIVIFILWGKGRLWHTGDDNADRKAANYSGLSAGDAIFLPKGNLHVFDAKPGEKLFYASVEYTNTEIDYIKHYYE